MTRLNTLLLLLLIGCALSVVTTVVETHMRRQA